MRLAYSLQFACLLSALSTITFAQDTGNNLAKLRIAQKTTVRNQPASSLILPVRCDEQGNYYVRFFHGKAPNKEPIYEFDKNGEQKGVFSLSSDPEFEPRSTGGIDFAVDKQGDVYELAVAEKGNYIIKFSKSGEQTSKVLLDKTFNALHFDVFESGNLLISGVDAETPANLTPHSPYTGVFDKNGKLLKKVALAEDKQYEEAANRGDIDFFDSTRLGGGNFAVANGSVVRGSDGNVYLVRWTNPAKIYAISPDGKVLNSFDVNPEQGRKKPAGVKEHAARLAIQFPAEPNDPSSIIKVVGLDGKEYTTHDVQGLGAAFVCYSAPERFAFFNVEGKEFKVNSYEP